MTIGRRKAGDVSRAKCECPANPAGAVHRSDNSRRPAGRIRFTTSAIAADGEITEAELDSLALAIERVLPPETRKAVAE